MNAQNQTQDQTNPHGIAVPAHIRQAVEGALRDTYGQGGIDSLCWHEPESDQLAYFATEGQLYSDFHFYAGNRGLERALACLDATGFHIECVSSCYFAVYRVD